MMKKIIALALALSMALSMVAFAGYTDADLINEDLSADVELVGALGIMQGNTDGSFNPTGTLTRAEAAVIIYRLHSGKTTIDASWGDKTLSTFTDMAHWSAPYVNYCAALGLIAGYPDGTFRPENPVTAAEMAKMLLNVAGYDTEKQGYGKNWPGAVLADASNAGLFTDYEAAFTGAASREWVAKMLANMIKEVNTVGYLYGDLLTETGSFGAKYGVASVVARALANDTFGFGAESKVAKDTSKLEGDLTIKFDIPTELLGHDVKVYFKDADNDETVDPTEKVYAVVDAAKKVTETTLDKITLDDGELVVNGVELDDECTGLTAYQSLDWAESMSFSDTAKKDSRPATVLYNETKEAWYVFYNKVEYVTVSAHDAENNEFSAPGYTGAAAGGTSDNAKKAYAKFNFVDTVAEGDYVAIETVGEGTNVTYNVSKPNAIRTKISSVTFNTDGTTVKTFNVGSTTYNKAALNTLWTPAANADDLKETYEIYTDGKYVVSVAKYNPAEDVVAGLNMNIAYLVASQTKDTTDLFASASSSSFVQMMLADGTIGVYEYVIPESVEADASIEFAVVNATSVDSGEMKHGLVYEYVLNEDGTVYFVKEPAAVNAADGTVVAGVTTAGAYTSEDELSKSYMTVDTNVKLFANENSFFFLKNTYGTTPKTYYSVVKASELGDVAADGDGWKVTGKAAYTIDTTSNLKTLVYASMIGNTKALPSDAPSASGSAYFLALGSATKSLAEGATAATYAVSGIDNTGVKVTLTLTSDKVYTGNDTNGYAASETPIAKNNLYVVKTEGTKTYLVAAAKVTENAGWYETVITAANNSVVMVGGELHDVAADATVIYVYDGDSTDAVKVTQKTADLPATIPHSADQTSLVKMDKDGNVTDLIITVTSKTSNVVANNIVGIQ